MKQALSLRVFAASLAMAAAQPAFAVPGGELGTLPTGYYRCEVTGDILGAATIHRPEQDFEVGSASTYVNEGGRGTYLLTGERVVMTNGPLKGMEFRRISNGTLRAEGLTGDNAGLRCVLRGPRMS